MKVTLEHPWQLSVKEAQNLQTQLKTRVSFTPDFDLNKVSAIAAADVSYDKQQKYVFGAVVIFKFPELELMHVYRAFKEISFPYLPGLLSFREIPLLMDIFRDITEPIDVLLCDGHGYAHPRRFGLACHLGVLLDIPAIGCAKKVLVGDFQMPGREKGDFTYLMESSETIGIVLRSRSGVKPIFVSVGHKMNLEMARRIVMACLTRYRLPEPLRIAHTQVNQFRQNPHKRETVS